MKKVTTINLNGNAYQLEEDGYEALRDYLEIASSRLEGNPDRDEILADIEQAIAEKFRAILGAHKTVVVTKEVAQIIKEMGPVEDSSATNPTGGKDSGNATNASASADAASNASAGNPGASTVKRLYRVYDGAIISGVCNGIAAYLNVDVLVIRILFVVLTFLTSGIGLLVYLLMALFVPSANTSAEKSAAYGMPFTAQEFIRRAREGYYEGMKTWNDRAAHRAWKRRFKHQMRGWGADLKRQIREDSEQWRQNWHQHWSQYTTPGIGASVALPLVSLLRAIVTCVGIFAMISVLTTGAVFGLALPADVPTWVGAILVFIAYLIVSAPLKAIRHAYLHCGYGGRYGPPSLYLLDGVIWLGFLVVLLWLADHYVPQAHDALEHLRPALQHAWESVRQWWAPR